MVTETLKIAMGLRKLIRTQLATATTADEPEVREAAAKVAFGGIDRLLDIGGWPKRPVGTKANKDMIDLRKLLDVSPGVGAALDADPSAEA